MSRVRRPSRDRQQELTDAALHLIATRGIAALSTRSLAAEVGISTGAIFRHFATLDALLEAVVSRVEMVLDETYPPPELVPAARLEQFVTARSAAVGQQLGILRLVLSEQFLLALPANGSARLDACVRKSWSFVYGCVRDGQVDGIFRSDVPAEVLVPIIMGTVQMVALSPLKPGSRNAPKVRAVVGGLLAVLSAPGGVRTRRKGKNI